jgi:Nucleotidyltransferase of unknown function (DUF6036)
MSGRILTRAELVNAFRRLDDRLRRDRVSADIFIFGGAAMVLGFNARDSTRDVDAVWSPHGPVQRAAHEIADSLNLPKSWLNDQASSFLPSGFSPTGSVAFEASSLRVIRAEPELMLAMKVSAFRQTDHEDILWLAAHLGLHDPETILEMVETIMLETLKPRQREDLFEMFKPLSRTESD